MTLLQRLALGIPQHIRKRGETHFQSGAVRFTETDSSLLEAEVGDRTADQVQLDLDGGQIGYTCTCPPFGDDLEVCEHVWAALLAAESARLLPARHGGRRTVLVPLAEEDEEEEWDDDSEDPFDDFEEDEAGPRNESVRARQAATMRRYWEQMRRGLSGAGPATPRAPARAPKRSAWKQHLDSVRRDSGEAEPRCEWPSGKELVYVLEIDRGASDARIAIAIEGRRQKANGQWGRPRAVTADYSLLRAPADRTDRQLLSQLIGTPRYGYHSYGETGHRFYPSAAALAELLPPMCATGRCFLRREAASEIEPLEWDPGSAWVLRLEVRCEESGRSYRITGLLERDGERIDLAGPTLLFRQGFIVLKGRIGPLDHRDAFAWIVLLGREKELEVPVGERDDLLAELLGFPHLPLLDLPEDLRFEEVAVPGRPCLKIARSHVGWQQDVLRGDLKFDYDGHAVSDSQRGTGIADLSKRRRIVRDVEAEREAVRLLGRTGFERTVYGAESSWSIGTSKLSRAVRELVAAGWQVEADGKLFRTAGAFSFEVRSGIDWFELHGSIDFGDRSASLPALLAALQKREDTIVLDDGTIGMVPEEWLRRYGILAGLGSAETDHLRFTPNQAGLLDALLAAEPAATCDEVFERARTRLRSFEGVVPADAPPGFIGRLREYQREGLGWMHFLREFGFGGCLADDMGLGKTIQALAVLASRRALREAAGGPEKPAPSLVVAPRSVIFNWKQEAERFTPRLRVLDYTGAGRSRAPGCFAGYDVVLTTYGTLRRDAAILRETEFDYVILDEAQAIKNAGTVGAKAARLIKGKHRLALSGTPVENHLGELWSLFEFLNPGMLGSSSVLQLGRGELRKPDRDARQLLAAALRPFILRRTKAQVAPDLPEKVEATVYCELDAPQRRLYVELRDHYRRSLLGRVEREGIARSKIHVLEALLRLRQAALHPGLIDPQRAHETSAKLEALLPQLAEVLDAGHKALVFSQFTSMLAILRRMLEARGLGYEYLDGKTRDRKAPVERFQSARGARLFLISLKAGGLGLNLTAAEYVFLLDPWWNPAVEVQAIDRTHRIGQTSTVFAYRLVARDTVEEKVLELQNTKRELADAIINADNSLIRDLSTEDLQLLLG